MEKGTKMFLTLAGSVQSQVGWTHSKVSLFPGKGLELDIFKVHSNPNRSMIL